jgi:hypothetical protein
MSASADRRSEHRNKANIEFPTSDLSLVFPFY